MNFFKRSLILFSLMAVAAPVMADNQPTTLDELLQQVREARTEAAQKNRERERRFIEARNEQQQMLEEARREHEREEARRDRLSRTFEENEGILTELNDRLQTRMGTLGELSGVVRQMSGDAQGIVRNSIVSAQLPARGDQVARLAEGRALPSIAQLESLWFLFQEEMTESGKVVKYPSTIVRADGTREDVDVVRVGVHNTIYNDRFLRYLPETGQLVELGRQPAGRYRSMAQNLYNADSGDIVAMAVDPSRGSLLALLIQTPSLGERIQQGGAPGYVIIALGIIGLLLVIERLIFLTMAGQRIKAQVGTGKPNPNNALGRVMGAYAENKDDDIETLELKIDEAILKETPALEARLGAIKIISAVAPLLGLLGTVVGMIRTFQMITLFGAGDPQLMADGISQALMTTAMGLTVAIPLVLLHAVVAAQSKRLVQILEEQSTGIIATHADKKK
ncbi:MotA/TolQ/ExbB proton channel family protein [Natronospira bacteriovora]|uniref:MotA/TolQ/ExbB proton channel family protein n=1 Tax=Natronospira bacteriovora TaxID=3069753 RepID=A0ABU0W646_9GAMM|nr:MotA/TolQ/ExbB proton channel family protein [Natronospira sp. AB-CW4]MDQ2069471.1 MotA/TolQ/ExbB proton channel family protein [Natronospira sp. AB-CW4]